MMIPILLLIITNSTSVGRGYGFGEANQCARSSFTEKSLFLSILAVAWDSFLLWLSTSQEVILDIRFGLVEYYNEFKSGDILNILAVSRWHAKCCLLFVFGVFIAYIVSSKVQLLPHSLLKLFPESIE